MHSSIVFEIDRILELNDKESLISFMGNEINARWVTREEMDKQSLNDMIDDFLTTAKLLWARLRLLVALSLR